MFADEASEPVSVESVWRKSQQGAQQSRACQTPAVTSDHAEVQTGSRSSSSTQTEPEEQVTRQGAPSGPDPPGSMEFSKRVEVPSIRESEKNRRSHAFDGFHANWEERSHHVSCVHSLGHPGAQERGLHVSAVSWSCTGSVSVCAYGRSDDGDWSNEKSCVCSWNSDRRSSRPEQPDSVSDVPAAVTAVCCHPNQPASIAGGSYTGEVSVWDTSRDQDPVSAQTGMSADSHREPVYQVVWVPSERKGDFGVSSSSSGGEVSSWRVDPDPGRSVSIAAYAFLRQQLPHSSSVKVRGSASVGVTALAPSPWDSDTFSVGSEGGSSLRCSFSSTTPSAAPEGRSVPSRAPAVFSFRPSGGPVHSSHCSPFHRNSFVSAGTDGSVRVHSSSQADPSLSVRVSDSYSFQVQWSPSRPSVFAAATGEGEVQIFDSARKSLRPAGTIQDGSGGVPGRTATCSAFNVPNPRSSAVGKSDGTVGVWRSSSESTEEGPTERSQSEHIANQVPASD